MINKLINNDVIIPTLDIVIAALEHDRNDSEKCNLSME